ncbi:MAG: hypothetical protein MK082_08015 [Phycisphaerales bacterium]|nr:hypothetical protein [Phycisphaerales bacterium]
MFLEPVLIASLVMLSSSTPDDALGVLTSEERTALATAVDDRDHQEAAFAALFTALARLEMETIDPTGVESWTSGMVIAAREEPDAWRGRPALLRGRLEQTSVLDPPWDGCVEWFVQCPDGEVVAIYLPREEDLEIGAQVEVIARHYKRISAQARDGTERTWSAFVGRSIPVASTFPSRPILMALVVGMLLAWFMLRLLSRRFEARTPAKEPPVEVPGPSTDGVLPTDPVSALDELARRHDDPIRKADQ